MDLSDVRARFPQYDNLTDKQLADALHAKFYSDIPKADFYERIGLTKPQSGFGAAFKASAQSIKGEAALLGGKLGFMSEKDAQRYQAEQEDIARGIFRPTEKGWTEAPLTKFGELLGGSLPYMLAPVAAGAAAIPLGAAAPIVGTAGAGLASLAQFTGTNLARQLEAQKERGEEVSLERASGAAAAAAAVPQAALDIVSLKALPLVRNLFKSVGKDLTEAEAKRIAEQGFKQTLADYAKTGARTAGIEGLTEAGQQYFERLQAGLSIADPDAREEYVDSFIGGAVLGAGLSPVGRFVERGGEQGRARKKLDEISQDQRKAALEEKAKLEAEEAEKRKQPEYLTQLQADYEAAKAKDNAYKAEIKSLEAQKDDPASLARAKELRKEHKDFQRTELSQIIKDYNKAGGAKFFEQFAEQQRVAALSPEDYMFEQLDKEAKTAREAEYAQLKARLKTVERNSDEAKRIKARLKQLQPAAKAAPEAADIEAEIMGLEPLAAGDVEREELNKYAKERLDLAKQNIEAGMATGKDVPAYLIQDPKAASRLVETKAQLPGMDRSQSNLILAQLSRLLREQGQELYEGDTATLEAQRTEPQKLFLQQWQKDQEALDAERKESTFDTNLTRLVNTALKGAPTVEVPEGATADRRGAVFLQRLDEAIARRDAAASNRERAIATGNRELEAAKRKEQDAAQQVLVQIEQQGGIASIVSKLRKDQESALLYASGLIDDLRSGVVLSGSDDERARAKIQAEIDALPVNAQTQARRVALEREMAQLNTAGAASSTAETLPIQISKQRARFIDAAIKEAAAIRRVFGKALSQDDALKAALQMQQVFDEWVTRSAAKPRSAEDLIKTYERMPSFSDQQWLNAALEDYKKQVVQAALAKKLVAVREATETVERRGAPANLQQVDELLAQRAAAVEAADRAFAEGSMRSKLRGREYSKIADAIQAQLNDIAAKVGNNALIRQLQTAKDVAPDSPAKQLRNAFAQKLGEAQSMAAQETTAKTQLTAEEKRKAEIQAADEFRRAYEKYQPRRPAYERRRNKDGTYSMVLVDKGKARLVDIRPLEERQFGARKAATEVLQEQLRQISSRLSAVPEEGRRAESLLRPQYAITEAQKTAEARGETAETLGGELRRRREYVGNLIDRALQTRPDLAPEIVEGLQRAQAAIEAGRGGRDVLTDQEEVKQALLGFQAVGKERAAAEAAGDEFAPRMLDIIAKQERADLLGLQAKAPAPFTAGLLDAAETLATRVLQGRTTAVTGGVEGARAQKGYDALAFRRDAIQRDYEAQQRFVDTGLNAKGNPFTALQRRKAEARLKELETQLTNLNKRLAGPRPTVAPVGVAQQAATGEDAKLLREINDALGLSEAEEGAPARRLTEDERAQLAQQGFAFGEEKAPVITKPMSAAERRDLEAQGQRFDEEERAPAKAPTKQADLFEEEELPTTAFARATARNFENSPPVKKARAAVERGKKLLADVKEAWDAKDAQDKAKRDQKIGETQEAIEKQREVYRETFQAALKKAQMAEITERFQKEITAVLQSLQAVSKERADAVAAKDPDAVRLIDVIRNSETEALLQLQADLAKALEAPSKNIEPAETTGMRGFVLSSELQAAADEWVTFERDRLTKLEDKLKRLQGAERKDAAKELVAQRKAVQEATISTGRAMSGLGLPGIRRQAGRVTPISSAEELAREQAAEARARADEVQKLADARKAAAAERETELEDRILEIGNEVAEKEAAIGRARTDATKERLNNEIAELKREAAMLEEQLGTPELSRTEKRKARKAQKTAFKGKGVGSEKELLGPLTEKLRDLEVDTKNRLINEGLFKSDEQVTVLAMQQLTPYERKVLEGRFKKQEASTQRTKRLQGAFEAMAAEKKGAKRIEGVYEGVEDVLDSVRIGNEDIRFSRGATATPSTAASVTAELKKIIPDLGRVQIYDSVDALIAANPQYKGKIPSDARGFVDTAGNKAFLIAENIDKGRALGVLLHEVGAHIGLRNMLGGAQYDALVKAVESWEKRNDGSIESRVAKAARQRVEAAETPANQVNDELLAYAIEEAVNAGVVPFETKGVIGQWLSRIASLFQKALQKFGLAPKEMTAQELVDMAMGAAKKEMTTAAPEAAAPAEAGELFFSKAPAYSAGLADAGLTADKMISQSPSTYAKFKQSMLGLGFRTRFLDALAPLEKVSGMVGDAVKGMQMMYYLRMYGMRMNFTSLSLSEGVPQLVEKKRRDGGTEWVIESVPGMNIKQIVQRLSQKDVIKAAGSADAANRLFTLYLAKLRADNKGYDKLNFGRAAAEAELKEIEKELASGKLSADDKMRVKQREAHLQKTINSLPTEADIKNAFAEIEANPTLKEAFADAREMYNEYNQNLLRFMVQTGAMSKEEADRLLKEKDYIPYYRVRNGIAELMIGGLTPVRIGNLKDSPHLQELVGGEEPIFNFLDSSVQNTSMLVDMAMRNIAVKNAMWEMASVGLAKLRKAGKRGAPQGAVEFKIDGEDWFAIVDTDHIGIPSELLTKGLAGIPTMFPQAIELMGIPARFLRRAITASPVYAGRQLFRDSLSSYMASGSNAPPVFGALQQVGKASSVDRRGITGGQVFTGTSEDMARLLREMQEGRPGWAKAFSKLEAMSMEADAATRRAQYESYINQGLSEMEATFMALESMNFSRRGIDPSVQLLTTLIPFMNAQIQSLDVLYRSLRGQMPMNERLRIREKLIARGTMLAGMSMAYAMAMQDDETYKNARPDEKYNNWFVPIPGFDEKLRVPIPFELGYIFKALPEALINGIYAERGADEAVDALKGIIRNMIPGGSNYGVPAAFKPLIEVGLGKSFFTGRDLESGAEQMQEPWARYRENTSETAKLLGRLFNISPIKIETLVSGYTGSLGMALMQIPNVVLPTPETDLPEKRMSQMPLVGTLFQPKDAAGIIDDTFDRLKDYTAAKETYEGLVEKGELARADAYLRDNIDKIQLASLSGTFRQQIGEITKAERQVRGSALTSQEKRDLLDDLRQAKILVASSVRDTLGRIEAR